MKIDRKKYLLERARACKTQRDLLAAGLSRGTITRINKGNVELLPETVGKVAMVFGCDVTDLINYDTL